MSEDVKPRIWKAISIEWRKDSLVRNVTTFKEEGLKVIELEPTIQLMKEMSDALKENGLSHDFDCGIAVNGRHECSCGYLKSKVALEKYRKFLEGIEK